MDDKEQENTSSEGSPPGKPERETSGEYLYKRLGLIGCIAVLIFMALVIISMFTAPPLN